MLRYTVNISFVWPATSSSSIVEKVATLKEAKSYEAIIDHTVKEANIVDNITGKVCVWLKKAPTRNNI